jgi:UPF0755 protein
MNFFTHIKGGWRILAVASLLLLAGLGRFGWFLVVPPGSGAKTQIIEVGQGFSLKRIANDLENAHVISSARLFLLYARLRNADARVKAGPYQFSDAMPPTAILRMMVAGDVYVHRFTIPEGYSIYQIAELLESRGLFRKEAFLMQCTNQPLLKELGISANSVEGYLYPSTYDIPPNMDETGFIRLAVEQFDKVYAQRYAARVKALGLQEKGVVTLASMVEKEAIQPAERPLVASVFLNRLRRGMRLQSDPTAVYGVRAFAGAVSKRDILRPSPYNTYLIKGLPPGPIGNPGGEAIEAVLNPARTDYLYFVAKKDGTHYFSANLDEHNRAVRKYLRTASAAEPATGYRNDYPSLTGRR